MYNLNAILCTIRFYDYTRRKLFLRNFAPLPALCK